MRAVGTLVAEALEQRAEVFVAGGDYAAIAGGDLLGLLEREASDVADGADGLVAIAGTPGLSAIFDQDELVLVGDDLQLFESRRIAGQVDGDDRLGLRSDSLLDIRGIEVVRVVAEVGSYRDDLLVKHADHGADVGDASGDHFVTGTNAGGGDRDV